MNDIIQFLLVLWAFLFSQSFQMYKNKDVLQKQKEKKKKEFTITIIPCDDNNKNQQMTGDCCQTKVHQPEVW